jgi:ketosteroid isomerase-like protein
VLAYKRSVSLQTRLTLLISCWIFSAATVCAAPDSSPNSAAEIQSVLTAQQEAWNRGDIDIFMSGYAQSPSTLFISGDEVTRGWDTVRERYRKKYSDRTKMGTLTFSDIEVIPLSGDSAVVLGRWKLERKNDQPQGRFTLVFKRLAEGWRIILDHTSAAKE